MSVFNNAPTDQPEETKPADTQPNQDEVTPQPTETPVGK